MPNLIVAVRFNPPSVRLMGTTLREETIQKLDSKLFSVTTTAHSPKQEPPKFEYVPNPPHWKMDVHKQYCDHLGRSMILLTIVEALEAEDWRMRGSHAITHNTFTWKSADAGMDTVRLFFNRP
eukprot:NODE_11262_length_466_cov_113.318584_g11239_i0.p2 GENE.NODE_11262_length_466_cov_113.318584_g11239_i0~~NODE_11262_length_466_cov_113.318584_g11239_i0.p2  ORF type:complete len:123 (+),score=21.73 NODE_11262_length_466_cov_113.318584_g11239_i0:70-438(+)